MAKMTLGGLVEQLQKMHGDKLRCVLLYGSAAAGDQREGQSNLNVLVLVEHIDPAQLEALGQTTRGWAEAGHPTPFELTVGEWERSADIFPMEYADILERHRVLFGELPTANITVQLTDLRRQTEFEAMAKVLRLRQGIMRAGTDAKQQLALLRASHSALMVIFRAVLRTAAEVPPADREALIGRVATLSGIDATPFQRVHALTRSKGDSARGEAEQLLFATLRGMEQLTVWLDRREPVHE